MNKLLVRGNDMFSRFMLKNMWKCPPEEILIVYNHYMKNSCSHLEIGTSSIYYPIQSNAHDRLNMNVTLLDDDERALKIAKQELVTKGGFHPSMIKTITCNPLEINDKTISKDENEKYDYYDTVAMNLVLQSIPESMNEKLPKILDGLSSYMDENTSFFGSTIRNIPKDGFNTFAKNYMQILQNTNYIHNENDTNIAVQEIMDQYFHDYHVKEIGYMLTFEGTKFKKSQENII